MQAARLPVQATLNKKLKLVRAKPAATLTTVVHFRDGCDVKIMRPGKWGNPSHLFDESKRAEVIQEYREWIAGQPKLLASLGELKGKRLGCCCAPKPCHGDVLAELANALPP